MTIDILVVVISGLMVYSKYLDCKTTLKHLRHPNQEGNPLARSLFIRFGSHEIIWIIFGVTILIVAISLWLLYAFYNTVFYKSWYILVGLIISIVQFAVAQTNNTQQLNFITKRLLRIYSKFK